MPEPADIVVGGEQVRLLPERAVWWQGARTLIIADLHLGKEHAFRALGLALPGGVLEETLNRLTSCIRALDARRVVVVGDLIHAKPGVTPAVLDRVAAWRGALEAEVWLVPGNHDRDAERFAEPWDLRVCPPEFTEGPFRFTHKPDPGRPDSFTWCGHLHPIVRLEAGADCLRLPCFHIAERLGILPAFSVFTGGSRTEINPGDAVWAVGPRHVFRTPAPAERAG